MEKRQAPGAVGDDVKEILRADPRHAGRPDRHPWRIRVLTPLWTETPETASRLRGRIEAVLNRARALGLIDENRANPARWKGHLDQLLPNPKKVGQRRGHHAAMPYADVPAFMATLKAAPARRQGRSCSPFCALPARAR